MPKKQMDMPGMEKLSHPDVDAAAEKLIAHRRAHTKSGQKKRELEQALIEQMKKAGVTEYRDDEINPPLFVTVEDDTKVHVKELKHEDRKPKKKDEKKEAA